MKQLKVLELKQSRNMNFRQFIFSFDWDVQKHANSKRTIKKSKYSDIVG